MGILRTLTLAVFLTGCGPGLYLSPNVDPRGFPSVSGYITHTRYLSGSFLVRGWPQGISVSVAIDGANSVPAEVSQQSALLKWKAPLPSRLSDASRWNIGSDHTAQVVARDTENRVLYSETGSFRMGTLQDANGDGFPDLVVGAYLANVSTTDDGNSFYYASNGGIFNQNSYSSVSDPNGENGQQFGLRSHFVGDLNGDGFGDIAFSSHGSDLLGTNRGGIYIAYGSTSGPNLLSMTRINCSGCTNGTALGLGIAPGGDINNDGYDDIIAGSSGGSRTISVFLGSSSGVPTTPNQSITYPSGDAVPFFGFSIEIIRDVSGDGYPDVVVGANQADAAGPTNSGAGFLYLGSSTGLSTTPSATYYETVPVAENAFGRVGWLGDINGDSIGDYFVSSIWNNSSGAVNVYFGAGTPTPPSTPSATITHPSGQSGAFFGHAGTSIGDVNGDAIADFAITSPGDLSVPYSGEVHLYLGQTTSALPFTKYTSIAYPGSDTSARFGRQVCPMDLDADGLLDLVVSADYADLKHTDAGAVFLIQRTTSGFDTQNPTVLNYPGSDSVSAFGNSLCASN
jgi:hypothetical protein